MLVRSVADFYFNIAGMLWSWRLKWRTVGRLGIEGRKKLGIPGHRQSGESVMVSMAFNKRNLKLGNNTYKFLGVQLKKSNNKAMISYGLANHDLNGNQWNRLQTPIFISIAAWAAMAKLCHRSDSGCRNESTDAIIVRATQVIVPIIVQPLA